jgi:hypothetical protein
MAELDEIEAMKTIASVLEPLDDAARQRALQWAVSRYRTGRGLVVADPGEQGEAPGSRQADNASAFESFADLYEAFEPLNRQGTDPGRILLGAGLRKPNKFCGADLERPAQGPGSRGRQHYRGTVCVKN